MVEAELMTLRWAGTRGYHAERKFPDILTDDELRAIDVPVLLITGARSALITPAEARARGSLMPHAEVAIVPQPRRLQPDRRAERPDRRLHRGHRQAGGSTGSHRRLNGRTDIFTEPNPLHPPLPPGWVAGPAQRYPVAESKAREKRLSSSR